MNVTFACPKCDLANRTEFGAQVRAFVCQHCGQEIEAPVGAISGQTISRCLVCPSTDLYLRKDFPQRLGVAIVTVGIVGSSVTWAYTMVFWTFAILLATALADLILYLIVGNALMCYRCHSQYRGVEGMQQHGAFELETHERYRQLEARLPRHKEPIA